MQVEEISVLGLLSENYIIESISPYSESIPAYRLSILQFRTDNCEETRAVSGANELEMIFDGCEDRRASMSASELCCRSKSLGATSIFLGFSVSLG